MIYRLVYVPLFRHKKYTTAAVNFSKRISLQGPDFHMLKGYSFKKESCVLKNLAQETCLHVSFSVRFHYNYTTFQNIYSFFNRILQSHV